MTAVLVALAEAEAVELEVDVGGVVVELEEEELHPARTPSATAAKTATPVRVRQWTGLFICSAFSLANSSIFFGTGACFASQPSRSPGEPGGRSRRSPLCTDTRIHK